MLKYFLLSLNLCSYENHLNAFIYIYINLKYIYFLSHKIKQPLLIYNLVKYIIYTIDIFYLILFNKKLFY